LDLHKERTRAEKNIEEILGEIFSKLTKGSESGSTTGIITKEN